MKNIKASFEENAHKNAPEAWYLFLAILIEQFMWYDAYPQYSHWFILSESALFLSFFQN